jgi:hypothetical protein
VVTVLVVTLVHVTSGGGTTCAVPQPAPSLPPRLRSLGGFDQPQDPSDTLGLEAFAAQAASAVAPTLIGTVASPPVRVHALDAHKPDALVVPLHASALSSQRPVVAGLVALLVDCAGRAYYSAVDDLTPRLASAPHSFPSMTEADAAGMLGAPRPQLVYSQSPFEPRWRNPDSGETIAAFAA